MYRQGRLVEAGLPSGTFSTADDALSCGKEVLVVPGSIMSEASRGSNRLLYQGATPIVDDESFEQALFEAVGALQRPPEAPKGGQGLEVDEPLLQAVLAQPLSLEELYSLAVTLYGAANARARMSEVMAKAECGGIIARAPDGRWTPLVR